MTLKIAMMKMAKASSMPLLRILLTRMKMRSSLVEWEWYLQISCSNECLSFACLIFLYASDEGNR